MDARQDRKQIPAGVLALSGVLWISLAVSGARASLGPLETPSAIDARTEPTPELQAAVTSSLTAPPTAEGENPSEMLHENERSELFQRISHRTLEFQRDTVQAPRAAAPVRDDESIEPLNTHDESPSVSSQNQASQNEQGDRSVNRRPAIDPGSSLEGSSEPQL